MPRNTQVKGKTPKLLQEAAELFRAIQAFDEATFAIWGLRFPAALCKPLQGAEKQPSFWGVSRSCPLPSRDLAGEIVIYISFTVCSVQAGSPFVEVKTLGISTRDQVSFSTNGERLETRPEEEAAKRIIVMTADVCTVLRFPENSCVHFPPPPSGVGKALYFRGERDEA